MIYEISYNQNRTKQITQAVKVLSSWIGESDSNSTRRLIFLTNQNNSKEIQNLDKVKANNLKKLDEFFIFSDTEDGRSETVEIYILSVGDRGLANGIYYLYMKLKDSQTQDPFSINWSDFQTPHFETRGIVLNFPFRLERLSTDTWSLSQWKDYLNRIRSFNYTSVEYLLGSAMLYHPD